jgi:alpha-L-arabinofuranosidase
LAEAAFMTGLERNSDVVVMSSYAPLLGHEEAWQWRPNLIWFDNLNVYATPSYYVQQLFSRHRGDVVLPVTLSDMRPARQPHGRIGLATAGCSAEFKDLQVIRNGQTLFTGSSLSPDAEMTTFGGNWSVRDGVIRQSDARAAGRAVFGDSSWTDYTLSLKARRVAGRRGLGIIFRNSEGGSFLEWTLGGSGNRQHGIEANLATHSEDQNVVEQVPGSIESDRWYDVRIKLAGTQVRCYLDGNLIHDIDVAPPELPKLFATASRDNSAHEVILKVINPTADATEVDLALTGVGRIGPEAHEIVLHGDPEAVNSLAEPTKIAPASKTIMVSGTKLRHTFLPHSLTILRFDTQ